MADTTATSTGEVLFSKTQQKVLGLLYGHPERSYYTNEIVRFANMGSGSVRRELTRMAAAGLLTVKNSGNQIHYQANPTCPIFDELVGIVHKTFGIADVLRVTLQPIQTKIACAFVYGSIAKNKDNAASDIDVMLIGEGFSYSDIAELFVPAEEQLRRPIHATIMSASEFKQKRNENGSFLARIIEQPKIIIIGSIHDI
jgi:predicted nucleotidyltransferase